MKGTEESGCCCEFEKTCKGCKLGYLDCPRSRSEPILKLSCPN